MALDYTNTLELLRAIERAPKPKTLFRDTFFPKIDESAATNILVDYRKGSSKLAPFISRNSGFALVGRDGFKTKSYTPPMMAPARPTSISDITKRGFGEHIESGATPAQRAQKLMAKDIAELTDMNVRTIEWMCVQTMLYAKFTVEGFADDGETVISDSVDFGEFTQKKTLAGNDMWSNPQADIYGVMTDMYRSIARNSGIAPNVMVTTGKTLDYMLKNEDLLKYLLRPEEHLSIAQIKPRIVSDAVTYWGTVRTMNDLQIYGYDATYTDENNELQQYIPDGYVIMSRTGAGSQLFGAITQMEADGNYHTYQGGFVPKVWTDVGNDRRNIRIASRCIPVPECIDDWYTLKAY